MMIKMKKTAMLLIIFSLVGCSGFKAKRVDREESDAKALEITDEWVMKDTETSVAKILNKFLNTGGFLVTLENWAKGLNSLSRMYKIAPANPTFR